MKSLLLATASAVAAFGAAQAAVVPTVLQDGVTVVEDNPFGDDSGLLNDANWFVFSGTAGADVDIDINRLVADPDLFAVLYAGDVTGTDFGTQLADDGGIVTDLPGLTFLDAEDDTEDDTLGGPFGDPRFVLQLPSSGLFSLVVVRLTPETVEDFPFEITARGIDGSGPVVPIPGAAILMGGALAGFAGVRRKKNAA